MALDVHLHPFVRAQHHRIMASMNLTNLASGSAGFTTAGPDGGLRACLLASNVEECVIKLVMGNGPNEMQCDTPSQFPAFFKASDYEDEIKNEMDQAQLPEHKDNRGARRQSVGRLRLAHKAA